jgi:hypothetical protein
LMQVFGRHVQTPYEWFTSCNRTVFGRHGHAAVRRRDRPQNPSPMKAGIFGRGFPALAIAGEEL